MDTIPPYLVTGIVSFVVGFFIGSWAHVLSFRKDRHDRLREFRDGIAVWLDKFESAPNVDLIPLHQASIKELRASCAKILEDIRWWRHGKFHRTGRHYFCMSEQDIRNYDPSHISHILFGTPKPKTRNIENWGMGRAVICTLLRELAHCAR